MLRDRRLGDSELVLYHGAHRSRAPLTVGEQLKDSSPHRISEHVKCLHGEQLYRRQLI